ncbi:helix-turn-helix transcriptional regulator [Undibacterium sp. RTI2.2]|uniref:helix-turn-helix transcriptional regulator n=1 Tax=unclassified Undibacterium TaxID=2630295 RepID=UPI003A59902E
MMQYLLHAVSQVHRFEERYVVLPDMKMIREACWREDALNMRYTDKMNVSTTRTIWPLAIAYFDNMLVLLAYCRLRRSFRMFRTERIQSIELTGERFWPQRASLLRSYLTELNRR